MGRTLVGKYVPHGTFHLHTATNYIQRVGSYEGRVKDIEELPCDKQLHT